MSLYLYCLFDDDADIFELRYIGETHGILGVPLSFFCPKDDFCLVVSDFPETSVPVTRENVLKHAAVVSGFLPMTTPLPFRFGTLATEDALDSFLTARSDALHAKQKLVSGCVAMRVKIIWDREWAEEPRLKVPDKPGTAFLAEKRREILGGEARAEEAKKIARWLEDRVGDVVREIDFRTITKTDFRSKLLLTVAHLVPR